MKQAVLVLLLLLSVTPLRASPVTDNLRRIAALNLEAPEMTQAITFGPLHSGAIIRMKIYYHNHDGIPQISRADNDEYAVHFPRRSVAPLLFIIDAAMACSRKMQLCSHMAAYVDAVNGATNIDQMPFIDEFLGDTSLNLDEQRQTPLWWASIQGGIESATLVINVHELAHATLNHLSNTNPTDVELRQQEGEADGFLLAFLTTADMSPAGGIAVLASSLSREERLGEFSYTHPDPSCREIALAQSSVEWVNVHKKEISAQGFGIDVDTASQELTEKLPQLQELREAISNRSKTCREYAEALTAGIVKFMTLADENTNLESSP